MITARRSLLQGAAAACAGLWLGTARSTQAPSSATTSGARQFQPTPGTWRHFEVTTRVDLPKSEGGTRLWLPVPSVNESWQASGVSSFTSNGNARLLSDQQQGVRMVYAEFTADTERPFVVLTSQVHTQDRGPSTLAAPQRAAADAATLRLYTQPTELLPTDGIVRDTALKATAGASTDVQKVRAIYEWVVSNSWREPKVRGCGEGDIKTMLETGNLGGKCADINALFVGLCRAVGIPARDVYGLRLAPSRFGYKELSGNSSSLKGAQHCRAEAYVRGHGWMAMDPADVAKVMRLETAEWVKTVNHPVVKPVFDGLFGGWEGNWLGWNSAHDVALPFSQGPRLGFFMYPVAENRNGRLDSYAPDDFRYQITAREV